MKRYIEIIDSNNYRVIINIDQINYITETMLEGLTCIVFSDSTVSTKESINSIMNKIKYVNGEIEE